MIPSHHRRCQNSTREAPLVACDPSSLSLQKFYNYARTIVRCTGSLKVMDYNHVMHPFLTDSHSNFMTSMEIIKTFYFGVYAYAVTRCVIPPRLTAIVTINELNGHILLLYLHLYPESLCCRSSILISSSSSSQQ